MGDDDEEGGGGERKRAKRRRAKTRRRTTKTTTKNDDEDEDEDDLSDDEDDTTARKKAKKRTLTTEIVKKLCENAEGGESRRTRCEGVVSSLSLGVSLRRRRERWRRGERAFGVVERVSRARAARLSRTPMVFCVAYVGVESRDDDDDALKPHANADGKRFNDLGQVVHRQHAALARGTSPMQR